MQNLKKSKQIAKIEVHETIVLTTSTRSTCGVPVVWHVGWDIYSCKWNASILVPMTLCEFNTSP